MRRVITVMVVVLVAAGGYWVYRQIFPPDRVMIRRQVTELIRDISFRAEGASPLAALAGVNRLLGYFTRDVEIRLGETPGGRNRVIRGQDELREVVLGSRTATRSIRAQMRDLYIDRVEGEHAVVQIVVGVWIDGDEDEYIQELLLGMGKEDGTWLIRKVEPIATLGI